MSFANLLNETLAEHTKRPHHYGALEGFSSKGEAHNTLCGDSMTFYVKSDDRDTIIDTGFESRGCAINKASGSLLTDFAIGKSPEEIEALYPAFKKLIRGEIDEIEAKSLFGELAVLKAMDQFPTRSKCAELPWNALMEALEAKAEPEDHLK